jgi:hypothetical protein
MAKDSNIVHQYFRKQLPGLTILVKINPIRLKATEITLHENQDPELREFEIDPAILEDLKTDGFVEASALEFNLYLSGLVK